MLPYPSALNLRMHGFTGARSATLPRARIVRCAVLIVAVSDCSRAFEEIGMGAASSKGGGSLNRAGDPSGCGWKGCLW